MDVWGWLPTAIAAVMFLGSAAVYLRGSRDKGTIATLEASNRALTERVTLLEDARERDRRDREGDRARIHALERENEVLKGIANSGDLIRALQSSLDDHHRQGMARLDQIHGDLTGISATLEGPVHD